MSTARAPIAAYVRPRPIAVFLLGTWTRRKVDFGRLHIIERLAR